MLQTKLPVSVNAIPPVVQRYETMRFLSSLSATEEQVMKGADISKACDHDRIDNTEIIKLCSEGFPVYFTHFINLSLSLCQ